MTTKWLFMMSVLAVAIATAGCGQNSVSPTQTQKEANTKSWSKAPEMQIDPTKKYSAEMTTSKGKFTIELLAKEAPQTVNNFVFLAKEGFYDDVTFHRIIESFMIQTGDPTGTGAGGPGYKFADELPPALKYEEGVVAMANAGKNTNGSQFFIGTGKDVARLNSMPNYTVFGKIVEGMDSVLAIAATPVTVNPNSGEASVPTEKVTIQSIKIIEQ